MGALTFHALRNANARRVIEFKNAQGELAHPRPFSDDDWTIAEWTNALCGEAGEAANVAKKLRRGDYGAPGSPEWRRGVQKLLDELADTVIYADLCAQKMGAFLDDAVVGKFNEVSRRIDCDIWL